MHYENLTAQQKLGYTDRCLWEEIGRNHDNETLDEPGWYQVITRSSPTLMANGVFRCEIADDQIDERIQEVIATYQAFDSAFHWTVAPTSRPHDLAPKLAAAGLHLGSTQWGVIADPSRVQIKPAAGVTVEPLSVQDVEEWGAIMLHGHMVTQKSVVRLKEQVRHQLHAKRHWVNHFLARYEGTAAGIMQNRYQGDYVYVLGAVVEPKFRARGVFASMLGHTGEDAAGRGFKVIASLVQHTSVSSLLKAGYEQTGKYENYHWNPA